MALYGTDQSKWQGNNVTEGDFIIIKATEGVGYVDPTCDAKYQMNKAAGKLLGVYDFARPDLGSAEAEAQYFVDNTKGYIGEAILVLDWEQPGTQSNVGWAKEWLDKVYKLTGVRPLIYMSASVVNSYDWSSVAKDYGLWIAGYPNAYNVPNPPRPNPGDMPYRIGAWEFWAIWQYTSSAGTLDRDIANMDKKAWKKYAKPNSEPAPTPTPTPAKKTNEEIADDVLAGKWGNGDDRKKRLEAAGYNYDAIQAIVNNKMAPSISYAVRRGDTLSAIAQRYGTTVNKIMKDNPQIQNADIIYPGQRIIIKK